MNSVRVAQRSRGGFLLVDALLASSILAIVMGTLAGVLLYGQAAVRAAGDRSQAALLAEEGLEVARLVREEGGLDALPDGTFGVMRPDGGAWGLVPVSDTFGPFTREVSIVSVDASRKDVTCAVSWQSDAWAGGTVSVRTRFTDWQAVVPPPPPEEEPAL